MFRVDARLDDPSVRCRSACRSGAARALRRRRNDTDDIVIDVQNLSKSFDGKMVVDNLSMQVQRGRIHGFLGPNGSGKTTTIRMLCGLLTPGQAARDLCLGFDILHPADRDQAPHRLHDAKILALRRPHHPREPRIHRPRLRARPIPFARAREAIDQLRPDRPRKTSSPANCPAAGSSAWRSAPASCPRPQLLLLDEPTAGVDPKARRDFWDEIHQLVHEGLTVLVSTHYMDEAERCHEIAYIAYGHLLAQGTTAEIIAQSHLSTYIVSGADLGGLAETLKQTPGVDMVAPFGGQAACRQPRRRRARPRRQGLRGAGNRLGARRAQSRGCVHRPDEPGAEQLPVSETLPGRQNEERPRRLARLSGSLERLYAVFIKELIQLRRDRLTFATMILIPVMQLILFGFAINSDPKHLPTAVLDNDHSAYSRLFITALKQTDYFDIRYSLSGPKQIDPLILSGAVNFAVEIPQNFARNLARGENPAILVVADAADPTAVNGAPSL